MASARLVAGLLVTAIVLGPNAAAAAAVPKVHDFVLPAVEQEIPVPPVVFVPNPVEPGAGYYAYGSQRAVGIGDFNGDGLPDIVFGPGIVLRPGFVSVPALPIRIWINTGGGHFEDQTESLIAGKVPTVISVISVLVADFNHDGVDDIFFVDSGPDDGIGGDGTQTGARNTLLLSGPDGKLHDATDTVPDNGNRFNHVSSLADINGDGNMDVVLTRLGGPQAGGPGGVSLLLGDGKGGFTATTRGLPIDIALGQALTGLTVPGTTTACDLDGDGRVDLITGTYHGGNNTLGTHFVRFFKQAGDGVFTEAAKIEVLQTFTPDPANTMGGAYQIVCGDIDGDGRNDVLVAWEIVGGTYLQIFRNDGGFQFTDITLVARGTYHTDFLLKGVVPRGDPSVYLQDFNGDGYLDIILRQQEVSTEIIAIASTTTSFILLNDGTGKFTPWHLEQNGAPVSQSKLEESVPQFGNFMPLVLDVNGDGRLDLVLLRQVGIEGQPVTKAIVLATLLRAAPANYQGLWWNAPAASESGWGINFAHQGDTIFATWFTYSLDGKPLWLAMQAEKTVPGVYSGKLFTTTGPPFNAVPFDPGKVVETTVGTATITFTDGDHATFDYTVNAGSLAKSAVTQTKAITRQAFGTLPACVWGEQPNLALATNYQDLWWKSPAGAEAGWGINFAHQGDTIFATWFTYDLAGEPWWLAVTANRTAPGIYTGNLFTTTGPPFNAVPFDPAKVVESVLGDATITFLDGNRASFTYTVTVGGNRTQQSKPITRQVFAAPGTVCH